MSISADRGAMDVACSVVGNVGDEVNAFTCSSGFSPLVASAFWVFLVLALFLLLWSRLIHQAWGKKISSNYEWGKVGYVIGYPALVFLFVMAILSWYGG